MPNNTKEYMEKYRLSHRKEMREYQHKYYMANRTKILAKNKEWRRMHCIDYGKRNKGGKRLITGLNKRPYPEGGKCELCDRECNNKMGYHHWDETNLNKGIWVCHICHSFAERTDDGFIDIYLKKKETIEKDYETSNLERCR